MIRVVVIEDDHDGAEVLAECLRIKGINVLGKRLQRVRGSSIVQKTQT